MRIEDDSCGKRYANMFTFIITNWLEIMCLIYMLYRLLCIKKELDDLKIIRELEY